MLKKVLVVIALSSVMAVAAAGEMAARSAATRTIELQDGSTAYVFQNGKMAIQNKYGNVVSTAPGTVLHAKDGSTITMIGNETAYLDTLLSGAHSGDVTP